MRDFKHSKHSTPCRGRRELSRPRPRPLVRPTHRSRSHPHPLGRLRFPPRRKSRKQRKQRKQRRREPRTRSSACGPSWRACGRSSTRPSAARSAWQASSHTAFSRADTSFAVDAQPRSTRAQCAASPLRRARESLSMSRNVHIVYVLSVSTVAAMGEVVVEARVEGAGQRGAGLVETEAADCPAAVAAAAEAASLTQRAQAHVKRR